MKKLGILMSSKQGPVHSLVGQRIIGASSGLRGARFQRPEATALYVCTGGGGSGARQQARAVQAVLAGRAAAVPARTTATHLC
jgi:hypothetical protein